MSMTAKPTIAIFGAGMSTRPLVHDLHAHGYPLIVASRTRQTVDHLLRGLDDNVEKSDDNIASIEVVDCDVETAEGKTVAGELIARKDVALVISMLPPPLHPIVAEIAVCQHRKHFCTASYVSPPLREIGKEAEKHNLVMISECGVDPGTDHMSAMRVIDDVHAKGGKVRSFVSLCGGLPAPAANTNPLGYKLSWAPRGVFTLVHRLANYLQNGEVKSESGAQLFGAFRERTVDLGKELGPMEWHPNGDSIPFLSQYGLEGECTTYIRGTYRYPGWCEAQVVLLRMGLAAQDPVDGLAGCSMAEIVQRLTLGGEAPVDGSEDALVAAVAQKLGLASDAEVFSRLRWLGIFSSEFKTATKTPAPVDAVCQLAAAKMQYAEGEADMICMRHEFQVEYDDGARKETIESTLFEYGETTKNGDTAMGRTVSLPLSIAVRLVLEGKFTKPGIQTPVQKELYEPILNELAEKYRIVFNEKVL